jgi:GrpB-like predicted nucleotidyltransferase (UPF0157 family)
MPLQLHTYDPNWPKLFDVEAKRISSVLGSALRQIEHVGSTAIPGLAAKPTIDIAGTVPELECIDNAVVRRMGEIGYEFVWHDWFPTRRFFRRGERGAGTHHLHIFDVDSVEYLKMILFRDFLRIHPDSAAAYGKLKQELATAAPDRQSYTDLKEPFVESILRKANGE